MGYLAAIYWPKSARHQAVERAPLKHALRLLLGPQLATFKLYMEKSSPLIQDRVLYVSGSSREEGKGQAYILIDIENRKLEVGIISNGKLEVLTTPGEAIYFPSDLEPMIKKLALGCKTLQMMGIICPAKVVPRSTTDSTSAS